MSRPPEELLRREWSVAATRIEAMTPSTASFIYRVSVMALDGATLTLLVPTSSPSLYVDAKHLRHEIEADLSQLFGGQWCVRFVRDPFDGPADRRQEAEREQWWAERERERAKREWLAVDARSAEAQRRRAAAQALERARQAQTAAYLRDRQSTSPPGGGGLVPPPDDDWRDQE